MLPRCAAHTLCLGAERCEAVWVLHESVTIPIGTEAVGVSHVLWVGSIIHGASLLQGNEASG